LPSSLPSLPPFLPLFPPCGQNTHRTSKLENAPKKDRNSHFSDFGSREIAEISPTPPSGNLGTAWVLFSQVLATCWCKFHSCTFRIDETAAETLYSRGGYLYSSTAIALLSEFSPHINTRVGMSDPQDFFFVFDNFSLSVVQ
jgi:hypothetical protein